jgi:serine/threonine-protein kinase HipA
MLIKLIDETSATPAAQKIQLLRWAIFQVLIGNTDAHGKNISFFCSNEGLEIAPAYDLTCGLAFRSERLDDTLAMAIGDAFKVEDITTFEWVNFAHQCGLPKRLVSRTLKDMAITMTKEIGPVMRECLAEGADVAHLEVISNIVLSESDRQLAMADEIIRVSEDLL